MRKMANYHASPLLKRERRIPLNLRRLPKFYDARKYAGESRARWRFSRNNANGGSISAAAKTAKIPFERGASVIERALRRPQRGEWAKPKGFPNKNQKDFSL